MTNIKKSINFFNLRAINPITDWEDIKEGETYHIPPLIYNKRMDFVVVKKEKNSMKIKKDGIDYCQTLFKNDITTRFVVKKQKIYGSTGL